VPLFWLNYRHSDDRAVGVVVIESTGHLRARLKAALAGDDRELDTLASLMGVVGGPVVLMLQGRRRSAYRSACFSGRIP
jgi:hypothetical protein